MARFNAASILSLLTGLIFGASCTKPPQMKQVSRGDKALAVEQGVIRSPAGFPLAASIASFSKNIYKPMLDPYCKSCHGNSFVDQNVETAHQAFLLRVSFNQFSSIDQTPIIAKLQQSHNCWQGETKKCVTAMNDGIALWLADLEALGFKPAPLLYPNATKDVALVSGQKTSLIIDPLQYAGASVDQATLAEPFIKGIDDIDGVITSYAMGKAGTPAVLDGDVPDPLQAVTFKPDVKAAGTYRLWARVKTPSDLKNGFFVTINGATFNFDTPVTGPEVWKWVQLTQKVDCCTEVPVDITVDTPGPMPIPIVFRSPEAKIDFIVLTQKKDEFDGEPFSVQYYDVAVDLPFANSRIIATIWEKTAAQGKKSLGVRELRIDSPMPLHIKAIYPLFNGIFTQNHGTYTLVDTSVGGTTDRSAQVIKTGGSTSSTWIADRDKDRLSFAFDVIEAAK